MKSGLVIFPTMDPTAVREALRRASEALVAGAAAMRKSLPRQQLPMFTSAELGLRLQRDMRVLSMNSCIASRRRPGEFRARVRPGSVKWKERK